jgi:hypothetical protein
MHPIDPAMDWCYRKKRDAMDKTKALGTVGLGHCARKSPLSREVQEKLKHRLRPRRQ